MAKKEINPHLTNRTRNLLIRIRDSEDGEIVFEKGGGWWVDTHQVNGRDAYDLIRLCLIKDTTVNRHEGFLRYTINECGRSVIDDVSYVPLIITALRQGQKD